MSIQSHFCTRIDMYCLQIQKILILKKKNVRSVGFFRVGRVTANKHFFRLYGTNNSDSLGVMKFTNCFVAVHGFTILQNQFTGHMSLLPIYGSVCTKR